MYFLWTSFYFWRILRIDYVESQVLIFSAAWYVFTLIAVRVGLMFHVPVWAGLLAGVAVCVGVGWRLKWDFGELWDLDLQATFGLGAIYFSYLHEWIYVLATVLAGLLLYGVKRSYRRWRWYKSGKNGLVGSLGLILWAIIFISHDFWQMSLNLWIGAVVLTVSVVAILLRSRVLLQKS